MGGGEFGLVLAFDTDDPEFTRGFEAGQLWERIERDGRVEQLIHAENAEMVMRIAESKRLEFRAEDAGDGWLQVVLAPHLPLPSDALSPQGRPDDIPALTHLRAAP